MQHRDLYWLFLKAVTYLYLKTRQYAHRLQICDQQGHTQNVLGDNFIVNGVPGNLLQICSHCAESFIITILSHHWDNHRTLHMM